MTLAFRRGNIYYHVNINDCAVSNFIYYHFTVFLTRPSYYVINVYTNIFCELGKNYQLIINMLNF